MKKESQLTSMKTSFRGGNGRNKRTNEVRQRPQGTLGRKELIGNEARPACRLWNCRHISEQGSRTRLSESSEVDWIFWKYQTRNRMLCLNIPDQYVPVDTMKKPSLKQNGFLFDKLIQQWLAVVLPSFRTKCTLSALVGVPEKCWSAKTVSFFCETLRN